MDYEQAKEKLGGRKSRLVDNNTRLQEREGGALALRLHETDVLTWTKDGACVFQSGGWRTPTTKDRMNNYGPGPGIRQEKGVWYIGARIYADGCRVDARGNIRGALPISAAKKSAKLVKAAKAYCAEYMRRFMAGEIPAPSGGDCWHCLMKEEKTGRTLGELSNDQDHMRQHMKEKYYVPSMITRAAEVFGVSIMAKNYFAYAWNPEHQGKATDWEKDLAKDQLGSALYRFVKRGLGIAA